MSTFPRVVAVTDDDRLAAEGFGDRLRALLDAGLPAVWLRGKGLPAGVFHERAVDARAATDLAGAELWIGDRADVARLVGADRLHLPEAGMPVDAARRVVGPGMAIGRSVHGVEAARAAAAEGVDHLVVGTIFASATHPEVEPGGPGRLTAVREALAGSGTPPLVYAIGGLDPGRTAPARSAGADGVVALRALWEAADPAEAVAAFLEALADPGR